MSAKSVVTGQSASLRDPLRRRFIGRCHDLIGMGYRRLSPATLQSAQEPAITGELVDAIRSVTEDLGSPRWVAYFECADDPPISAPGRAGKYRRRVDLAFVRVQRGRRPRFQVEAKRLHTTGSIAEYLGEDGLGRILSGDYAAGHPDAGMLGYVQACGPDDWAGRLSSMLSATGGSLGVCLGGAFQKERLSTLLSHTFRSVHDRTGGETVDVYHTLLQFN